MRLPVVPELSTKNAVANKNARMTNVLNEKGKAVIRPGLSDVLDYAGVGAGLIPFNGCLLSIFGDTVYADNAPPTDGGGGGGQGGGGIAGFDVAWNLASGSYAAGTTYAMGDQVWYGGHLWTSLVSSNTGNTPPALTTTVSAYWTPSFPPAWNSGYTYSTGANVHYGGYIWYSLVNGNINHTPEVGAYWDSYNPPASSTHTLTAVYADNGGGNYTYGMGSIAPTTLSGSTINTFETSYLGSFATAFSVDGSHAQDFFTSITCNGVTLNSASAGTYLDLGASTLWIWGQGMIDAATDFPVTIT